MRNIVMSIHPKHAEAILNGTKTVEFRKTRPRKPFGMVIVYATAPVKRIVGQFEVSEIIAEPPKQFALLYPEHAETIAKYLGTGNKIHYAWLIGKVERYKCPISLCEFDMRAPQSWQYIESIYEEI